MLATNGMTSYAMFLFPENGINWYSGDASNGMNGVGGIPAQVGLNKGDGIVYYTLNVSSTPAVINVSMYSNIDGAPSGFYMWNVNNVTNGIACTDDGKHLSNLVYCTVNVSC